MFTFFKNLFGTLLKFRSDRKGSHNQSIRIKRVKGKVVAKNILEDRKKNAPKKRER